MRFHGSVTRRTDESGGGGGGGGPTEVFPSSTEICVQYMILGYPHGEFTTNYSLRANGKPERIRARMRRMQVLILTELCAHGGLADALARLAEAEAGGGGDHGGGGGSGGGGGGDFMLASFEGSFSNPAFSGVAAAATASAAGAAAAILAVVAAAVALRVGGGGGRLGVEGVHEAAVRAVEGSAQQPAEHHLPSAPAARAGGGRSLENHCYILIYCYYLNYNEYYDECSS